MTQVNDSAFDNLVVVDHPVIQDRLSYMRSKNTSNAAFKKSLQEISHLMSFLVTAHLPKKEVEVETPIEKTTQLSLKNGDPVLVSVLRAGLGMSEPMADILSNASIGYIGVSRNEKTKKPEEYLVKLPTDMKGNDVILIDPMLATGHSLCHAIEVLKKNGVDESKITCMTLLAAPEGVAEMKQNYPAIKIFTASLDKKLNEDAFIVPGLGDAGDRLFGT